MSIPDISSLDTCLKVSHFILPSKAWDIVSLQQLVIHTCLQAMLATPIPYNPIPDSICWGLSRSGDFSTKSATWVAHGLDLRKSHFWEFRCIWKLDIMPKLKILLWQLCHATFPTRGNLIHRGMDIDPLYPHCNVAIETAEHLFVVC